MRRKLTWPLRTVEELFDILNISKRYQLDDLTDAINNHFKVFPFTLREWSRRHNALKVVAYAEEFEQKTSLRSVQREPVSAWPKCL